MRVQALHFFMMFTCLTGAGWLTYLLLCRWGLATPRPRWKPVLVLTLTALAIGAGTLAFHAGQSAETAASQAQTVAALRVSCLANTAAAAPSPNATDRAAYCDCMVPRDMALLEARVKELAGISDQDLARRAAELLALSLRDETEAAQACATAVRTSQPI